MITVDEIHRLLTERKLRYHDRSNVLVVKISELSNPKIDKDAYIYCTEKIISICTRINEIMSFRTTRRVLKAVNALNHSDNFCNFVIGYSHGVGLEINYCIPVQYVTDPQILLEILTEHAKNMDKFYYKIIKVTKPRF